jgi:hypothetical protein
VLHYIAEGEKSRAKGSARAANTQFFSSLARARRSKRRSEGAGKKLNVEGSFHNVRSTSR